MTVQELVELRCALGMNQQQMAEEMGLGTRSYEDIEAGKNQLLKRHRLLAERCALSATYRADPINIMLMPLRIREEVLAISAGLHPVGALPSQSSGNATTP